MSKVDRHISLKTFRVDANSVDFKTGLPEKLKLLNWGENTLNTGEKVVVDEISEQVFSTNQRAMGRETAPIDYEHHTVPGTPAYEKSRPSDPVAGYCRPYIVKGGGLFVDTVTTTADGLKNATNFKDLSPAPWVEDGRVVAMHSMALTVAGAVEGLTLNDAAIRALSATCNLHAFSTDSVPNAYKNGQTDYSGLKAMNMDYFRKNDPKGELTGKTDDEAMAIVQAKWCGACGTEGSITPNSMNQTPKWPDTWDAKISDAVKAVVTPLNAEITELKNKLAAQGKTDEAAQKQAVITEATREGKIITLSAGDISGFSVEQLKKFTANVPKAQIPTSPLVVPLNATQVPTLTANRSPEATEKRRLAGIAATSAQVRALTASTN